MEPDVMQFNVGETVFKQPLVLTHTRAMHGHPAMWTLRQEQGDQRDDTAVITGLSDDVILKMADAVKGRRR